MQTVGSWHCISETLLFVKSDSKEEAMTADTSADTESGQLVTLLWGQRAEGTRGPRPSLTVEQIVAVAIEIADQEGVNSVSMHGLAEKLGYSKMALYRYFNTKDELLAVMIDAAVGPAPPIDQMGVGWRKKVEAYAEALFATWQQHPWLPMVTIGARAMGPNEVDWAEQALAALEGTGLNGNERIDVTLLISAHVRTAHSLTTAGTFPWDENRRLNPTLTDLLHDRADRYPAILAALDSPPARPITSVHDGLGLSCILDGVAERTNTNTRQ